MPSTPSFNGHPRNGHLHTPEPRFTVPSPNGGNGAPDQAAPPSPNGVNGRDSRGRFARGNKGGPGNPFARRVARLRTLLLDLVSDDDLRAVLQKLIERARSGDIAAARLLFFYLIGRPGEAVDPDRLGLEEWRLCQEFPSWEEVLGEQSGKLDPEAACTLAQILQRQKWEEVRSLASQRQQAAEGQQT